MNDEHRRQQVLAQYERDMDLVEAAQAAIRSREGQLTLLEQLILRADSPLDAPYVGRLWTNILGMFKRTKTHPKQLGLTWNLLHRYSQVEASAERGYQAFIHSYY